MEQLFLTIKLKADPQFIYSMNVMRKKTIKQNDLFNNIIHINYYINVIRALLGFYILHYDYYLEYT